MSGKNFVSVLENSEGGIEFIKAKTLADEGTTGLIVEGVFIEAIPNSFDSTKSDYKLETAEGKTVIVNSTASLAFQMKQVDPGTCVQILYNGMKEIKTKKGDMINAHDFSVLRESA